MKKLILFSLIVLSNLTYGQNFPGKNLDLLIGKELTKAIKDLDEPYFNDYYEHRVLTDDNVLNGFTYEECKKWVMIPIINPRTFEQIRIDSPIYNRLLCMTYQYDCYLIPRMITSRGALILNALKEVLQKILINIFLSIYN